MPQPHTGELVPSGKQLWTFDDLGNLIVAGNIYTAGVPDPTKRGPGQALVPGTLVVTASQTATALQPSGDTTGVTDTAVIQRALDAYDSVTLLPGTFWVNTTITVPSATTLTGTHGRTVNGTAGGPSVKPVAGWAGGSAVLSIAAGQETEIGGLTVDCSLLSSAAAIDAVNLAGTAVNGYLHDLYLLNAPRGGFNVNNGTATGTPGAWVFRRVAVFGTGNGAGINPANMTDSTFDDCYVLSANQQGWYLAGMANCAFIGCRSEWSGTYGWQIDGSGEWGTRFTGCSTDRSTQHGVLITATGVDPVNLSGLVLRRDGAGSTSAGYAGLAIANNVTNPLIVGDLAVFPGTNDDGSGNDSPEYGLSIGTGVTYLSLADALLWGVTAGISGSLAGQNYRAVATQTGSRGSPSGITQLADGSTLLQATVSPSGPVTITGVTAATLALAGPSITPAAGMVFKFEAWGTITTTADTQTISIKAYLGGLTGTVIYNGANTVNPDGSGTVTAASIRFTGTVVFLSATAVTAQMQDDLNYFVTGVNQGTATVAATAGQELVLGITPSADAVSVTINGGYWQRIA